MKGFKTKDVPMEVIQVWVIQSSNTPIGVDTHKKCEEVINNYPEWFPWEHKYKSIPQSVHDAFSKECYPSRFELDTIRGSGLMATIDKYATESQPVDLQEALDDYIKSFDREAREKANEEIRARRIWNKYYRKYKLEYRA